MNLFGWLFGMAQAQPIDTEQTVRAWIVAQNAAALEIVEVGDFPTPQGWML